MTTSDNKIICPKCNSELPQDSGFCQYCGSKIEISSTTIDNAVEENSAPVAEESVKTENESETVAKILASGIVEGQKAMEANKENQPHNELDADFGLVPQKPVYTVGIDEQEKYLKALRTVNGEPIKRNRRGSMSVDGVNGMVDVYDTYLPSGAEYKTIYINMYGTSNSTFAPKGFSYEVTQIKTSSTNIKSTKSQGSRKQKPLVIIAIVVLALALIVAGIFATLAIIDNVQQKKEAARLESQYNELKNLMLNVDGANYKSIGTKIDSFSSDYRDIDDIKIEYNQLKKNIETIEGMPLFMRTSRDSESLRNAYVSLVKFNQNNHRWDLSEYLNDTVYEEQFSNFVFGKEWSNADYNFLWSDNGNGGKTLKTNLPNDKDYNKDYYFYTDNDKNSSGLRYSPTEFGYENQNDENDKFLAYRIVDVTYSNGKWQIRIYCYSNSRTYTLE